MSENIFGCLDWGGAPGIEWVEKPGMLLNILLCTGQAPVANHLTQDVHRPEDSRSLTWRSNNGQADPGPFRSVQSGRQGDLTEILHSNQ